MAAGGPDELRCNPELPKQRPSSDLIYADLVRRYRQDPVFADLVEAAAAGLGLAVLAVTTQSGAVLAAMSESAFEVKIDEYARRVSLRDRNVEKVLHGLIHLAVAALCFLGRTTWQMTRTSLACRWSRPIKWYARRAGCLTRPRRPRRRTLIRCTMPRTGRLSTEAGLCLVRRPGAVWSTG